MRIIITSDHAGYELGKQLYQYLRSQKYDVIDAGPYAQDEQDDYPDFVAPVAHEVSQDPDLTRAIVIGGSGQGEAIMANRFPRVRAVVFNGQYAASGREIPDEIKISRTHNDANILSLGARFVNFEEAKKAVDVWLKTPFLAEPRHVRRIQKIEDLAPTSVEKDSEGKPIEPDEDCKNETVHNF